MLGSLTCVGTQSPFLYPIIDTGLCRSRRIDPVALCDAYVAGGARLLQLREKERSSGEFLRLPMRSRPACEAGRSSAHHQRSRGHRAIERSAPVFTSGRTICRWPTCGSCFRGPAIVGLSTHDDRPDRRRDCAGPDLSRRRPIFATSTKDTGYSARGLDLVRRAAVRGKPVVAIGGLTLGNMLRRCPRRRVGDRGHQRSAQWGSGERARVTSSLDSPTRFAEPPAGAPELLWNNAAT